MENVSMFESRKINPGTFQAYITKFDCVSGMKEGVGK